MANKYGPWATLIDAGGNPQLSTFWKRRMSMLVHTSQTSAILTRRYIQGLGMLGILICLLPTFRPVLAEQPQDFTALSIEQLTAAFANQLASIKSLQCEYGYQFGDKMSTKIFLYARSGNKWHHTESVTDQDASNYITECCDGQLAFSLRINHQTGTWDHWDSVYLRDPHGPLTSIYPDQVLGESLSNVERSLVDALKAPGVSKSIVKLPDGTDGILLLARDVPGVREGREKIKHDVAVTLDPKHDLLPAEILVTQSEKNITWPGWEQRWKILEYRRVADELAHQERWFPVSAVLTQGSTGPMIKMTIDDVKINSDLPPVLFRPNIPGDVWINDETTDGRSENFIKGRSNVHVVRKTKE
jgi:hypothetical protein